MKLNTQKPEPIIIRNTVHNVSEVRDLRSALAIVEGNLIPVVLAIVRAPSLSLRVLPVIMIYEAKGIIIK